MIPSAAPVPGYRYGDASLPPPPLSTTDFARLQTATLFDEADVTALRRAGEILVPQTDAILDVWYGFVGAHDFLVASFATPEGPSADYLARVRARFGRWIADTCRAEYDATWLAYQFEIGRRHYPAKNVADGAAAAGTPPVIHWRYVNAFVYPIYATVRPFLEKGSDDATTVDTMHQAWLKAVLLQATLWSYPYVIEGAW